MVCIKSSLKFTFCLKLSVVISTEVSAPINSRDCHFVWNMPECSQESKITDIQSLCQKQVKGLGEQKRDQYYQWIQALQRLRPSFFPLHGIWMRHSFTGYVNSQNSRYWAAKNPNHQKHPLHSKKVGVVHNTLQGDFWTDFLLWNF